MAKRNPFLRKLSDYLYLFLYRSFSWLTNILPDTFIERFFHTLAKLFATYSKKHRQIIETNLDLAFSPPLDKTQKEKIAITVFYNLLQVIRGIMQRDNISKASLLSSIEFQNDSYFSQALSEGKRIVLITGHYSNWELLPLAIASKYNITLAAVGRKLDSNMMDRILRHNRERFGVEIIYRKGAMRGMIKALKESKVVGLLPDQSLGEKQGGIKVDFFGKPAGHSPAASILARSMDAVIIPVFIHTEDYQNHTVTFYPPIPTLKTENKEADIQAMTQAQADVMQKVITEKPDPWFWVHKRWKVYLPELYKK